MTPFVWEPEINSLFEVQQRVLRIHDLNVSTARCVLLALGGRHVPIGVQARELRLASLVEYANKHVFDVR